MYSESDIDAAVTSGAITREAAQGLRDHVATLRQAPAVDEEQFRLLTGFNDIFVSIACVLLLAALAGIGAKVATLLAPVLVTAASWGLAEYFTRERRMALPSIILLIAFVGGVATTLGVAVANEGVADWIQSLSGSENVRIAVAALIAAVIAAVTAAAAWLHWRRFMVPTRSRRARWRWSASRCRSSSASSRRRATPSIRWCWSPASRCSPLRCAGT